MLNDNFWKEKKLGGCDFWKEMTHYSTASWGGDFFKCPARGFLLPVLGGSSQLVSGYSSNPTDEPFRPIWKGNNPT